MHQQLTVTNTVLSAVLYCIQCSAVQSMYRNGMFLPALTDADAQPPRLIYPYSARTLLLMNQSWVCARTHTLTLPRGKDVSFIRCILDSSSTQDRVNACCITLAANRADSKAQSRPISHRIASRPISCCLGLELLHGWFAAECPLSKAGRLLPYVHRAPSRCDWRHAL